MNKVFMIGRLAKDNETKYYNDKKYLKNTIAVQRDFKNKDGEYDSDFFTFTAWGNRAEYLQNYTHKGSRIAIVGKIQNNNYEKQDGTKVFSDDIQVENIEILEPRQSKNNNVEQKSEVVQSEDENLPF